MSSKPQIVVTVTIDGKTGDIQPRSWSHTWRAILNGTSCKVSRYDGSSTHVFSGVQWDPVARELLWQTPPFRTRPLDLLTVELRAALQRERTP